MKSKAGKCGIDQLNAAADQRYLGTYIKKFLVSGKPMDRNNRELTEAYRIVLIESPSYAEKGDLDEGDRQRLCQVLLQQMGGR